MMDERALWRPDGTIDWTEARYRCLSSRAEMQDCLDRMCEANTADPIGFRRCAVYLAQQVIAALNAAERAIDHQNFVAFQVASEWLTSASASLSHFRGVADALAQMEGGL